MNFQDYHDQVSKHFRETPLYEPIEYKVSDIRLKITALNSSMEYLMTKLRLWKPRPKAPPTNTTSSAKDKTAKEEVPEPAIPETTESKADEEPKTEEKAETTEKPLELPEGEEPPSSKDAEAHQEL